MVCNWIEMLEAAKEAKQLAGLLPVAQQCLKDKVANASAFHAIVLLYLANDLDSKAAAEAAMLECFAKCSEELPENWRGKRPTFEPELTLFMKGLEADIFTPANRYDWFTRFDRLLRTRGQTTDLDSLQKRVCFGYYSPQQYVESQL